MKGRKPNHFFIYNGKTYTAKELSVECRMNLFTLRARLITRKWSVEEALTTPVEDQSNRYWTRRVNKAVRKVHEIIKANNGDIVWYIKQCRMLDYRLVGQIYREIKAARLNKAA
jgi:hypothetical protein